LFISFIYENTNDISEITNTEKQIEKEDKQVFINSSLIQNEECNDGDDNFDTNGCVSDTSEVTFEDDSLPSSDSLPSRLAGVPEETDSDYDAESEDEDDKPVAVELLASLCFFTCAGLLATPVLINENSDYAFSVALIAFLAYEGIVGLYMPCESLLRTIYMPNDSICSLMTMLRVIVNVAVALGVISTNYILFTTAFAACSGALIVAAILQLSLVQPSEWNLLKNAVLARVPLFMNPITSDNVIRINSSLKLGELGIGSPIPDAKRLSESLTSPSSVSSLNYEEPHSCVEPKMGASEGIRRRPNSTK